MPGVSFVLRSCIVPDNAVGTSSVVGHQIDVPAAGMLSRSDAYQQQCCIAVVTLKLREAIQVPSGPDRHLHRPAYLEVWEHLSMSASVLVVKIVTPKNICKLTDLHQSAHMLRSPRGICRIEKHHQRLLSQVARMAHRYPSSIVSPK